MDLPITLLEERLAKAEAKAARAEKVWETAKNEVSDLVTALRVMRDLSTESAESNGAPSPSAVADRQRFIVDLLNVGEAGALPPFELYEKYRLLEGDDITIDTFRTTIWRMKDRPYQIGPDLWLVKGDAGKYWKEPGTFETRMRHEARHGAPVSGDDDDFDTPF